MKHFARENSYGFTKRDVVRAFPGKNPRYLSRILCEMVRDGMLYRAGRDNFHLIPFRENSGSYVPDVKQVAKCFMKDRDYYFGYASALAIQGLSRLPRTWGDKARKPENKEAGNYLVTKIQMHPSIKVIGQINCHFITHKGARFFGYEKLWINHLSKGLVSDLEKTIVDACTKPQYCGGILMVANAIYQAMQRTDSRKLFHYFTRNGRESAKRRFLYLVEILGMRWTCYHDTMMNNLEPGISILEPSGPKRGRICSKFGLKINVDPDTILNRVRPRRITPEEERFVEAEYRNQ